MEQLCGPDTGSGRAVWRILIMVFPVSYRLFLFGAAETAGRKILNEVSFGRILLQHVLPDHIERRRSDIQYCLMEFFL